MVGVLLETRAVGEPYDETEHESGDGAGKADYDAIRSHHEADMAVRGARRLEHADRPEPALGEDGEAADGDEGDEQHSEHERRE